MNHSSERSCQGTLNFKCMSYLYFILYIYQLTEMCYSRHTDFLSQHLSISKDPNGESHKKIVPEQREAGLTL